MCLRYYHVTFRGQPLARVVLGGGEATETMAEWLSGRLDLPCEMANPCGRSASMAPPGEPVNGTWPPDWR